MKSGRKNKRGKSEEEEEEEQQDQRRKFKVDDSVMVHRCPVKECVGGVWCGWEEKITHGDRRRRRKEMEAAEKAEEEGVGEKGESGGGERQKNKVRNMEIQA